MSCNYLLHSHAVELDLTQFVSYKQDRCRESLAHSLSVCTHCLLALLHYSFPALVDSQKLGQLYCVWLGISCLDSTPRHLQCSISQLIIRSIESIAKGTGERTIICSGDFHRIRKTSFQCLPKILLALAGIDSNVLFLLSCAVQNVDHIV